MTQLEETLIAVCCFLALALGVCGLSHHEDLRHAAAHVYVLQCGETTGVLAGDVVCTDLNPNRGSP